MGSDVVRVSRRAVERLRAGHLWVYRTEVEEAAGVEPGAVVTVVDGRGGLVGSGLYSAASQIAVRMVSAAGGLDRNGYLEVLRERLAGAVRLREELGVFSEGNDAGRLVFSEADGLPGIVVDRYGDLAVVQLLTQGTAQADVREVVTEVLSGMAGVATVVERPDPRVRELEQLEAVSGEALFSGGTEVKLQTVFTINGLRFGYDAGAGQKTGAFLDQRLNYAAAARYGRGRALDCCTYQGGFALHLAQVCEQVTGVDKSRAALEVADANAALNGIGNVDWIEGDVFDVVREFEAAGERYDTVVLDPPAFAKSKRALEGAMRGYRELNLRAMKMLRPGGTLVTCSCSQHVSLEEFTGVVAGAAADARMRVQVLETRGASPDHPAVMTLPETSYLKCLLCRVA